MTIPMPPAPRVPGPRLAGFWTSGPSLAIGWAIAILIVCWMPRQVLPVGETSVRIPHHDKYIHAAIFGIFAILGMIGRPTTKRFVLLLASGVALAVISELGQELPLVNRDADLYDALADTAGLVLGLGLSVGVAWFLARSRGIGSDPG